GFSRDDLEIRVRPLLRWNEQTNIELAFPPVQNPNRLVAVSPEGAVRGFAKFREEGMVSQLLYRLTLGGRITVRPVGYGDAAYIGSDDGVLYAVDSETGKVRWRYTAGTRITRQPVALDDELFVTSDREGLARVDRETGEAMWRIRRGGAIE